METRHISAEAVRLALVSSKLNLPSRWCAMSAHTVTKLCRRGHDDVRISIRSMPSPMDRGYLRTCIDRVLRHGATEVRRTFGLGVRALVSENLHHIPR